MWLRCAINVMFFYKRFVRVPVDVLVDQVLEQCEHRRRGTPLSTIFIMCRSIHEVRCLFDFP